MEVSADFEVERYAAEFARDGYFIQEGVLSTEEVEQLRAAVARIPDGDAVRRKRGVYGVRNLLEICPEVQTLARQPQVRQFVSPTLGDRAFAVRAILFDKIPDANWSLFWHQDNVVSVAGRKEAPGYTGWSCKAGVWQVQPPAHVLARMVAVRVHLDDCGPDNGPLRVLPGSHRYGWLDEQLDEWKKRVAEIVCEVRCGGVVAMCPLTLHASSPAQSPSHRRVIHIEYAHDELPEGLDWNSRVR
jgi:ectoine hydroxylase-related dioxygenase (phytanoyl-CoA dioxygenase family)